MADECTGAADLDLQLSADRFELAPGGPPGELTVVVHNQSRVVEQCTVDLVDVDPYLAAGQRKYALIMVDNTGPSQVSSTWLDNVTTDRIGAEVTRTSARVIDIEPLDVAAGTFDAIVQGCPCPPNWWAAGLDGTGLTATLGQTRGASRRWPATSSTASAGSRRHWSTTRDPDHAVRCGQGCSRAMAAVSKSRTGVISPVDGSMRYRLFGVW